MLARSGFPVSLPSSPGVWNGEFRTVLSSATDVPVTDIFGSLAYAEVKLILARVLYNFDMELVDPDEDWMDQKAFFIWTKPPLNIYLTPVM